MEKEIWKPVVGYEGRYEVSNKGNVKSLNYNKTGKEKLLKHNIFRDYLFVVICKNGERRNMFIHRAVAEAFIPNPDNLPCINHKNEIKTDNRLENLEFCTHKYNIHYSKNWEKSNEVIRKPVLQFTKDGVFVKEYPSSAEAGRQTGIKQGNISRCCLGRKGYKSAGNYIWKFKYE